MLICVATPFFKNLHHTQHTSANHSLKICVFNEGGGGPAEPRRRRNLGGRPQSVHGGLHGEIERGDILSEVVLGAALRLRGVSLCGERVRWKNKPWQFHSGNTHPEVWGSHRQPQEQRWRQPVEELKSNLLALKLFTTRP